MKNIWKLLGIITLSVVLAFSMTACGGDDDPDPGTGNNPSNPTAATFTLTQNGKADTATTIITINFNKDVSGLAIGDITVTGKASKGATVTVNPGDASKWNLAVGSITEVGTATVAISKSGITTVAATVRVYDGILIVVSPLAINEGSLTINNPAEGASIGKTLAPDDFTAAYYIENALSGNDWITEVEFPFAETVDASEYDYFLFDMAADTVTILDGLAGIYSRFKYHRTEPTDGWPAFTLENNSLLRSTIDSLQKANYNGEFFTVKIPISAKVSVHFHDNNKADYDEVMAGGFDQFMPRFIATSAFKTPEKIQFEGKIYFKNFRLEQETDDIEESEKDSTVVSVPTNVPINNSDGVKFDGNAPTKNSEAGMKKVDGEPVYFARYPYSAGWSTELEFGIGLIKQGGTPFDATSMTYFSFDVSADSWEMLNGLGELYLRFKKDGREEGDEWDTVQYNGSTPLRAAIDALNFDPGEDTDIPWITIKVAIDSGTTAHENPQNRDSALGRIFLFMPRFIATQDFRALDPAVMGRIYFKNFTFGDGGGDKDLAYWTDLLDD
jgi:hypothetical protein